MAISTQDIVKLRESTGAGMMDCKKALEDSNGDFEKAVEYLRKKGAATSAKRADREAKEGIVSMYSHGGRIGAMVEVNCETDFVARNEDFQAFAKDIAMQVAAAGAQYITREEVPQELLKKEKELYLAKAKEDGKPAEIAEKIAEGKIEKFYEEICLLDQNYIKDNTLKVRDLLNEKVASIGEKIEIRRFARFELGQ
jgi:elongation factor Ts